MKQVITKYVFNPALRTITFPQHDSLDLGRIALVTNVTTGQIIFQFNDVTKGGVVAGNVLTLNYNTDAMNATDSLRIDYEAVGGDPVFDRVVVGNAQRRFRDSFASIGPQPDPNVWTTTKNDGNEHIINQGGNAAGSSYLRISLSPFVESSEVNMVSNHSFTFPLRVGFGVSISQRVSGQEVFVGVVAAEDEQNIDYISATPNLVLTSSTATVTSNVATFTQPNHGLQGGDRVTIVGCAEKRLNVGPVVVTPVTKDTFTAPITIANGTYSVVGGFIRLVDPLRYAKNGAGLLFENTTTTNASLVSRRNGAKFRLLNSTVATTTAIQANTAPYTDAFNAASVQELYFSSDEMSYRSYAADSLSGISGQSKYSDGIPDEELPYKLQIRARRLNGITLPVGRIINITKTASSTATVTTDVPHGLSVGDYVQIYGVRDATNFANQTAQTVVATVPSDTTFTTVIGTSTTATSNGGTVFQNQGSVLAPGIIAANIQSVVRSSNVLTVTSNTTISGPLPGEYVQLHGMTLAPEYDGAYKVLRLTGSTLELESVGDDFTSISTGGAIIRRTDVRIHFARVMDYTRLVAEIVGGKVQTTDANNAVPVVIAGAATQSVSQSTGTSSSMWNAAGYSGFLVADIASAAITTTATSGTITPGSPSNIGVYSNSFNVNVTSVSGTNPTLDVSVDESPDGTNWFRIYDFPRITAIGSYVSPTIKSRWGYRYRYVRTITGTSPSFTMALNRLQFSTTPPYFNQFFDRTILPNTINSTTPSYYVDGSDRFSLFVNLGAVTTPPSIMVEGSEDNITWYEVVPAITGVANSVVAAHSVNVAPKWVRARVSSAGSGVTLGYVSIKARE